MVGVCDLNNFEAFFWHASVDGRWELNMLFLLRCLLPLGLRPRE